MNYVRSFAHANRNPTGLLPEKDWSTARRSRLFGHRLLAGRLFLGTAALCYFFGGSIDLIVPLLSLGVLTVVAKYVTRDERPS
jgi:hypothetical protein